MAEQKLVRGLLRGLSVLHALNRQNFATAQEIARATDLPRSTVYRLLDTLMSAGYVRLGPRRETYALTILVRTLSDGFDDAAWVTQIASPLIAELGREIVWPTDIATFDRDAMVIRDTTHARSPLSMMRGVPGLRVPVLMSSLGRAYLAFCPDQERRMVLRHLASGDYEDSALARDQAAVMRLLGQVRERGYGFRQGGIVAKTGSIAVPVNWHGRVFACLNMHYILSAMTEEQAAEQYLEPMRNIATRIESQLEAEPDLTD